jgi:hypothetical protein
MSPRSIPQPMGLETMLATGAEATCLDLAIMAISFLPPPVCFAGSAPKWPEILVKKFQKGLRLFPMSWTPMSWTKGAPGMSRCQRCCCRNVFARISSGIAELHEVSYGCPRSCAKWCRDRVVILNDGAVHFPDGQEVTVLAGGTALVTPRIKGTPPHSVLDIPAVSLGPVLHPLTGCDDLLGEMLEGRP